jgi:hypothetical protein
MMFANLSLGRLALAGATILGLWPSVASAQDKDQVINVYFQPLPGADLVLLNKAIQSALSQPPLQLAGKPFAGVLVIAVSGKVEVTRKRVSGTYFDFTVSFTRDGSSLGESAQSCKDDTLSECTDQLVQDVKSVAAIH